MTASAPSHSVSPGASRVALEFPAPEEIDASCRGTVLLFFVSAVKWLVFSSLAALLASVKLHGPALLANCSWLTYGRLTAAASDMFLYGFASQAGFGVMLWLLAREGGIRLQKPYSLAIAAVVWNIGVLVGTLGILAGDMSGYEFFQMPAYAIPFLFAAYLFIGVAAIGTFHLRQNRTASISQWFLFAATFWFPWIMATAAYLLHRHPVRGVTQTVVNQWYAGNFEAMWLGSIGLAVIYYFLPLLSGRPLHSRPLAVLGFWFWIFFSGLTGIRASAPLPSWMASISIVAGFLTLIAVVAHTVNWRRTMADCADRSKANPAFGFIVMGAAGFTLSSLLGVVTSLRSVAQFLQLTWFTSALSQLGLYGFFAMSIFGAIYFIVPRLTEGAWPKPGLIHLHFWCAILGLGIFFFSMTAAGAIEGAMMRDLGKPFADILKASMMPVRFSTLGLLLLVVGHFAFLGHLVLMLKNCCCTHCCGFLKSTSMEVRR